MSVTGSEIVAEVKKFAGYPYVYGDKGPSAFDCSGLVQYVLTQLGVKGVPRTSEAQWGWVTQISKSDLQPGDLVFAQFPGDNASPGHVGIYTGGGEVLSAQDEALGVGYATLSSWGSAIVGYGRPQGLSGASGSSSSSSGSSPLSMLLSLPSDVTGMFSSAEKLAQGAMWFFNPENWARVMAGVFGFLFAAFGLGFLIWAGT
jgi:hypothetical protein